MARIGSNMRDESSAAGRLDSRLRSQLRMAFVPTVFTLLSRHERYLAAAIDAFVAPPPEAVDEHAARTREIGREAAAALVSRPLRAGSATQATMELLDRYNEVNPRSLLVTTPLALGSALASHVMEPPLPPLPSATTGDALLTDVRACHGGFKIPALWRELADGWPEHAGAAWSLVRALPLDERFARGRDAVLSLTRETVDGRAGPTPTEVGCGAEEALEITEILAWYQVVIPTMVVEIECLRRALVLGASPEEV